MDFKKFNRLIKKFVDEPHEKIILNAINIIIFSFIYYMIHLYDKNSFMINELMLMDREKQELNYFDFLYYSTLLNFTISFGDMVPLSREMKIVSAIHTFIFWYIALF